jgi:hypothetical protein
MIIAQVILFMVWTFLISCIYSSIEGLDVKSTIVVLFLFGTSLVGAAYILGLLSWLIIHNLDTG